MSQIRMSQGNTEGRGGGSLLQVSDLNVTFRKSRGVLRKEEVVTNAVKDVSFSLDESDALAIVGESGSGKTTTARCILGLMRPTSGSIKVDGVEVTKLHGRELIDLWKKVQIIYQDPFESLNPRHDVFTTISLPLRNFLGMRDEKQMHEVVCSLLQEVDLDPKVIRRYPYQLSGGQMQRVNIARALAPNPKLLVADEPITMVDAAQKVTILSLLRDLQLKRNLAVLLITHDLASAKILSKKALVMFLGRVVEMGRTDVILSRPSHPYVELILSAMPNLASQQEFEDYTGESIEDCASIKEGCVYRPRCNYATEICSKVDPPLEKKRDRMVLCHNPLNTT